jgi:hypothetical protein
MRLWTAALAASLVLPLAASVGAQDDESSDGGKREPASLVSASKSPPRTSDAVAQLLETTKIDLDLDEVPLLDALAAQGRRLGVSVVVDEPVRAVLEKEKLATSSVTLKAASGRAILTALLAVKEDLTFEVWRGTVFVTSKTKSSKIPPVPALSDAAKKAWEKKSLDLECVRVPLKELAPALSKATGLEIAVGAKSEGTVSLSARSVSIGAALDLVCRLAGLKVVRAGAGVELRPQAPGDKSAPSEAATSAGRKMAAAEGRKSNDALERDLDEKKTDLDFEDAALSEVLDHIQEKSGLSFAVDAAVDQTKLVTANANELSVRVALAKVLTPLGYVAEVKNGVLVVRVK